MEDAYATRPNLYRLPNPLSYDPVLLEIIPSSVAAGMRRAQEESEGAQPGSQGKAQAIEEKEAGGSEASVNPLTWAGLRGADQAGSSAEQEGTSQAVTEHLHYFGVFDGHGGPQAAEHCALHLHHTVAEALRPADAEGREVAENAEGLRKSQEERLERGPHTRVVRQRNAPPMGDVQREGPPRNAQLSGLTAPNFARHVEAALTAAFTQIDAEFGKARHAGTVGTTAVVLLVGEQQLYVANCGDSRAVLSRCGKAVPLTDDHKASRADEVARVEAAGGQIMYWAGARVMGVLDMSRAIGDHGLSPYVIPQPEVTVVTRHPEDELMVLASDGLWDVLSQQAACTLARRCLFRAKQRGASARKSAAVAASVLTRAALDKGSSDNVTVLVVDLSKQEPQAPTLETSSCPEDTTAAPVVERTGSYSHSQSMP